MSWLNFIIGNIISQEIFFNGDAYMIKEYREKRKYTQEELAEIINISPRQLQRIEKDEYSTRLKTFISIIKTLDIPDNEIADFMKK